MRRFFRTRLLIASSLTAMIGCDETTTHRPLPTEPGPSAAAAAADPRRTYIVAFDFDAVSDAAPLARRLMNSPSDSIVHIYNHAIKGFSAKLTPAAAEALRHNPMVKYVEQDQLGTTEGLTARYLGNSKYWALDRIDQRDQVGDFYYRYANRGSGVHIYIVDTGVQTNLTEFAGRIGTSWAAAGNDPLSDCEGHGTAVASAAAGTTFGVASDAIIHAVRVDGSPGCDRDFAHSDVVAGIDWVISQRNASPTQPTIINISASWGHHESNIELTSLRDAVRRAHAKGIVVVAAAGNDNENACNRVPADVAEVITVGASTIADARWSSSNFGSCLDLFAPGVSVTLANRTGGETAMTGTSFAAPHVAGSAALVMSGKMSGSPALVAEILKGSATAGEISSPGSGSPNRLLYSLHTYARISGPGSITAAGPYTWSATAYGGDRMYSYTWQYIDDLNPSWTTVGTGSSYSRYVAMSDEDFSLRLLLTSAGETIPYERIVQIQCTDGGGFCM